jgi:ubiquinol-cytochrome c reductase iron-sulfur subunit
MGAPLVVVRLDPAALELPPGREGWAPRGILAYSKICTHAGCAVNLYRKPKFAPVEPRPALICPCHYSTFDPAQGAKVIFGPAGRPLPQLPLTIDRSGHLRATGNFSGAVGPAWWGVRNRSPKP